MLNTNKLKNKEVFRNPIAVGSAVSAFGGKSRHEYSGGGKKLVAGILALTLSGAAFAQSFEGVIEFKQQSTTDTVNRIYYVKGDKVRIDEIGTISKKVEGSYIIDLTANTMTALSHARKIYFDQTPVGTTPTGRGEVIKTKNSKTIHGYKCREYIVTNKEDNIKISFWMAAGKFDFFSKMMKLLKRKDRHSLYYVQMGGVEGMFPFLSTETTLDGKERSRMEVTKIEKKTVDAKRFEIPAEYTKRVD